MMNKERVQGLGTLERPEVSNQAGPMGNNRIACRHYWLIEAPEGPTSLGVCRYCGQERTFENRLETHLGDAHGHEFGWGEPSVSQSREL